jgi:hypothetical protein
LAKAGRTGLPVLIIGAMVLTVALCAVLAQSPQPFPKVGPPSAPPATQTPGKPAPPVATLADPAAPSEATLGAPVYPGAEFLTSYDAGQGQRYYLYGTNAGFVEIVNYYRTVLKQKGELVYEAPGVHQFDIGRFREETMAFPPSVTVKDYTWGGSAGYLNPKRGRQPARFKTIIQIVPPAAQ